MIKVAIQTLMLVLAILCAESVFAQAQPQPAPPASPAAAPSQPLLTDAELDALVAPIALYPDALLAEVLMASAYPLEVVQAERWLQANKNLKGDQLKSAVDKQPWDESIKSLVATPSVLEMMSNKLDWTQKLGHAVVAQQPDVMDAVQRLRARAQANNKLTSTKQQTVTTSQVQGKQVIGIEPTDPDTVYVPYYDPAVVYGEWPYADYPPYYFPPPPYLGGFIATGIAFGAGYALGRWTGSYWNGSVNWGGGGNNIVVNPPGHRPGARPSHPISGPGNKWQPKVEHRQGAGTRSGRQPSREFRGSGGQQVINPAAKTGSKPGQGARGEHKPNVAKRPSQKPSAKPGPSHKAVAPRHKAAAGPGRPSGVHARTSAGRAAMHRGGGGGQRAAVGGRGGGARAIGGRGGRGGGRRSDIRLKHDVILLGHLDNGLGFYRFSYNGSNKAYVGVMAQEAQQVMPQAVVRGRDGYLRVYYNRIGVHFESYNHWIRSGSRLPNTVRIER